MSEFKVTYVRTITEIYEAVIEAEDEYEATDAITDGKYGGEIPGETLVESYTDSIEVTDVEENVGG